MKSDTFLDLGRFTDSVTQVEQLRLANFTSADNLNMIYCRRIERPRFLNADAVGYTTYGEVLVYTATLALNDNAFEHLDTFSRTFNDTGIDTQCVTYTECRYVVLKLLIFNLFDDFGIHELTLLSLQDTQ